VISIKWIQSTIPLDDNPKSALIHYYSRRFNLHPTSMYFLFNKGISNDDSITSFLYPSFENLYNPFLLNDMNTAVNRILKALERNERILIFGDYDVGATRF